jgi:hypothetical protein
VVRGLQVERATVRTTWTPGPRLLGSAWVGGGRDGSSPRPDGPTVANGGPTTTAVLTADHRNRDRVHRAHREVLSHMVWHVRGFT